LTAAWRCEPSKPLALYYPWLIKKPSNNASKRLSLTSLTVNEEQITPAASFLDDLGADSLDTVELIMAFEEEFKDEIKGEIPESDAEKLQTVGQVIDYIKAKAVAK